MDLSKIGEMIFKDFIDRANENGYPKVAEEIQWWLDNNGWDCMTDIPLIVSEAYKKFGGK